MFNIILDTAMGFVTITTEVASNSFNTAGDVASNTGATILKVTDDSLKTVSKIATNIGTTGMKIVVDSADIAANGVSDIVDTTAKVANDTASTVEILLKGDIASVPTKVLSDTAGTGAKIVIDMGKTLAKTTGDVAGTGVKVLLDSSSTVSKVAWDTLTTADKIVQDTANVILQVRDDTLTTSVHAAGLAVSPAAADAVLEFATKVFTAASASAIVDTILGVIHRSLEALTQSLSGAALILRDIYTNDANKVTTSYILNNLPALFLFLYDLIKPENVIPGFAPAVNGVVGGGVLGGSNPYNELDLEQEVNRNALVYQAQRLALSLVEILRLGRDYMPQRKLEDIKINVKLRSDFGGGDKPPEPTYTSKLGGDLVSRANEKWLFVNGIANELVWFEASCNKVRDRFGREVKGVFNRSDGFLWDLVECAGERSAAESNKLIERTESSRAAQTVLGKELESALWPEKGTPPEKVVMIAHSQGCLLLRLVLQDMVQRYGEGSPKRNDMKERLRVFTFANPSIDWRVIDDGTKQPLSSYAKITEHFAHELDFVARLGVATHQRTGYGDDVVFYSTNGRGHLFGAHYPLEAGAYEQGAESKLLRAVDGNEIS